MYTKLRQYPEDGPGGLKLIYEYTVVLDSNIIIYLLPKENTVG